MRSCLPISVVLVFATTSSSCTSQLLGERLGADTTIVWLLQLSELFVSSFSSLPGCTSCTSLAVVTALAGAWWSVWHSRLSHTYTDRPVYVTGGAIFALPCPCCPAASTFGAMVAARESPITRPCCEVLSELLLSSLSLHRAFPAAHLAVGVLTPSACHLTRSTQALSFWKLYSRHGSVILELLVCDVRCC